MVSPTVFGWAAISMEPFMKFLLRNPIAAANSDNRKFSTVNEPMGSYLPDLQNLLNILHAVDPQN